MKLINAQFDSRIINDSPKDKHGRWRRTGKADDFVKDAGWYCVYPEPGSYLDFEESEAELDRTIGSAYYNERKFQPRKQSMRIRWNRGSQAIVSWWDERPGGSGHTQWSTINNKLDGHIRKYIGKPFADCLSDLKDKVLYNKDWRIQACGFGSLKDKAFTWRAWRERFFGEFEGSGRYPAAFYIDDEGNVQETAKPKKVSHKHITVLEGEMYYVPNWGAIAMYANKLADARVDITKYGDKIPWDVVNRWRQSFRKLDYLTVRALEDSILTRVDNRVHRVVRAGTKEWYKLKKKRIRSKNPDRSTYYDRSLWVSDYLSHHKEPGITFHGLMNHNIEDLRRDAIVDVANRWIRTVPPYKALIYGKKTYINAIVAVMKSAWLDKVVRAAIWDAEFQLETAVHNYLNPDDKIS